MNYHDIREALGALTEASNKLEETYINNGGEVTAETEALEAQKKAIEDLLTVEGIDSLGRWYKSKEDELATWKAEKALSDRRIKSVKNTLDFIKGIVADVLRETNQERVKGNYYSFKQTTSTHTSVDMEAVEDKYLEAATEAARSAGLPEWCNVAIVTNVKLINAYADENGDEGREYIITESTPTAQVLKPAKAKEEVEE